MAKERARCFLFGPSGEVYVSRVSKGRYLPLGGVVEEGESPEEAVIRELWEEIGISPDLFDIAFLAKRPRIYYYYVKSPVLLRTGKYQAANDPNEVIDVVVLKREEAERYFPILKRLSKERKTASKGDPIPREEALKIAKSVIKDISPYVLWATPVGSLIRWPDDPTRQHKFVHDIDILVVPRPGLEDLKLKKPEWKNVNFFLATKETVEPTLIHWGLGKAIIHLKREAKKRGFKLTRYGLMLDDGTVVRDARKIFKLLGREMPPHIRNLVRLWRRKNRKRRRRRKRVR